MNVLQPTELYPSKWLGWQMLCYVYFTTILKLEKSRGKTTNIIKDEVI